MNAFQTKNLHEVKDYFFIAVGVMLYAVGVTLFMLPYGLTTGGVAGISTIVYYATGVEVQVTYVAINAVLLIIGIKTLGVRFCIKTIYAVAFMTFSLWLMQRLAEEPSPDNPAVMILPKLIGEEAFMACVLAGIAEGLGLAFCFENNGSTGGTDIIALVVNKYRQMSLGTVIMVCDIIVITSCYFIFHDWYRVIYGYVMLVICSVTLDYAIRRRHQSVQFMIFSRNPEAIANAIIQTGHGATILDGMGWFTKTSRKVVVSVIRNRQQNSMLRMLKTVDPYAFVSMTDASGVWGEGFDAMKVKDSRKTVLVCATNNQTKIDTAQSLLGDYDVRSLLEIGCDTRQDFYSVILGQSGSKRCSFVKKFFGFDSFYVDQDGKVTLVRGNYEDKEYDVRDFVDLMDMKAYLDAKK